MLDCRSKYARPGEHHCSSLPSILPIPGMDTLHRLPLSEQNAIDPERRGEVGEILVEYKAHRDTGANLEPVLFFNYRIYCYLLELRVVEWLIMEWMLQSRQTPCEGWDYIPTDACQENGIRTFWHCLQCHILRCA